MSLELLAIALLAGALLFDKATGFCREMRRRRLPPGRPQRSLQKAKPRR